MALLDARKLTLRLRDRVAESPFGRARPVTTFFRDVNLRMEPGESVGIVGESVSDKTSLARTLLRLYEPTAGSLYFGGRDITHLGQDELRPLRSRILIIFQDPLLSLNPCHRTGTILAQPLLAYGRGRWSSPGRVPSFSPPPRTITLAVCSTTSRCPIWKRTGSVAARKANNMKKERRSGE